MLLAAVHDVGTFFSFFFAQFLTNGGGIMHEASWTHKKVHVHAMRIQSQEKRQSRGRSTTNEQGRVGVTPPACHAGGCQPAQVLWQIASPLSLASASG